MNYFKNTYDVLAKYIELDNVIDSDECVDKTELGGQIKWDESWSSKDYKIVDGHVGIEIRNSFSDDLIEAKIRIQTMFIDSYKKIGCPKTTAKNRAKIKELFNSIIKYESLTSEFSVSPDWYSCNKTEKDGYFIHPDNWTEICTVFKNTIVKINDGIIKINAKLSDILTDMVLEQLV